MTDNTYYHGKKQIRCVITEKRQITWAITEKRYSMCYHGKKRDALSQQKDR